MPCANASSPATTSAARRRRLGLLRAASLVPLAALAACAGGVRPPLVERDPDDTTFAMHAFHGVPVLQRSFFWDGNGEVDDSGVALQLHKHLSRDVAVGVGANFATWWDSGSNIHSAETEARFRLYPFADWPLFFDGSGGFQLADKQIPEGGTVWNFTFSFGPGFELPLAQRTRFQIGSYYHHISNALGRTSERNPSQNEVRFWLGLSFVF